MTTRTAIRVLLSACILGFVSCASVSSSVAPGQNLSAVKRIYVERNPKDRGDIDGLLAKQLTAKGYHATHGAAGSAPSDADAILRYNDKWMWDITLYLLQLDLKLHDAKSGLLLAEASSYRPSMERREPAVMVAESLASMLKN